MAVPPKLKLNLRLTEAIRLRAQALAEREGVSLNTLLVRAVENYLPFRERYWQDQDRKYSVRLTHPDGRKASVNEPCVCGSGKKFKHCHGKPSQL